MPVSRVQGSIAVSGLKKMKNKKFHLLKIEELKFSPEVARILKESYIKNLHQILFFDSLFILISLFPKKKRAKARIHYGFNKNF